MAGPWRLGVGRVGPHQQQVMQVCAARQWSLQVMTQRRGMLTPSMQPSCTAALQLLVVQWLPWVLLQLLPWAMQQGAAVQDAAAPAMLIQRGMSPVG